MADRQPCAGDGTGQPGGSGRRALGAGEQSGRIRRRILQPQLLTRYLQASDARGEHERDRGNDGDELRRNAAPPTS